MSLHRNESKEFKQGGRATDAPNSTFGPNASFQVHLRAGPPDGRETELPRMAVRLFFSPKKDVRVTT